MHLKSLRLIAFKRFTDLTINNIPDSARLVILAGPNGTGKTSVFDAFAQYQSIYIWGGWDESYHLKTGVPRPPSVGAQAQVFPEFYGGFPEMGDNPSYRRMFYFRTAYRLESDFTVSGIASLPPVLQARGVPRMNATDTAVSDNYHRIVMAGLSELFGGESSKTVGQVRDDLLRTVRESMGRVFGDLLVENVTNPLQGGAFYFAKGASTNFHYKNLSGGERAAFDLLLDLAVKRSAYDDSIYCIDEPETHLNTRVQGLLLDEMIRLVPDNSQLWVASHSLGMLRAARQRQERYGDVVFLDFEGRNYDDVVVMEPVVVDRTFWQRTLRVALDDLAELVAPKRIVLVEGRPRWEGTRRGNAEFDAACLRQVFGSIYPDTEFVSIGSAEDVQEDKLHMQASVKLLTPGVEVLRVVDRDDRSDQEVEAARREGTQVLSWRDLENYLLHDEVLTAFCGSIGRENDSSAVLLEKARLLADSVQADGAPDDEKRIAGDLYKFIQRLFLLRQAGNTAPSFMRDSLAPLLRPGMAPYEQLRRDIFGAAV